MWKNYFNWGVLKFSKLKGHECTTFWIYWMPLSAMLLSHEFHIIWLVNISLPITFGHYFTLTKNGNTIGWQCVSKIVFQHLDIANVHIKWCSYSRNWFNSLKYSLACCMDKQNMAYVYNCILFSTKTQVLLDDTT